MVDTNNFVVERKKSDVEAENSGTVELISNSESDGQESQWIRKIRSGLKARSGQNAGGYVPIIKLPACVRKPVECFTPQLWQFGLHNHDRQASSSESEVLKISIAAACKLNPGEWDKFCDDVVDNPADIMLKSYGIQSNVTELSSKEVQYLLTLDALTLVLVLSSLSINYELESEPESEPESESKQLPYLCTLFIRSLVDGGFNIEALAKDGVANYMIWHDLFLCENQIPMPLMKKAISKCYGLLPDERKSNNHFRVLRKLKNPDSNVTKELLDKILKFVATYACRCIFSDPWPLKKGDLFKYINDNYEVGKLENCPHIFAVIHKVMTSRVESTATDSEVLAANVNQQPETDGESTRTDTWLLAPDLNQQLEADVEAPPIAANVEAPPIAADVEASPIAVPATFGRAKQFILRAVATSSKQLVNVIAMSFFFSRKTAPEEGYVFYHIIQSATDLKKAGLKIRGIPGMVRQVAFKDGCLSLPIMLHTERIESHICNMAVYETWNTSDEFPFIDPNTSDEFPFMDYLKIMSQLIKTPEDVSYLVDCNVLRTYLGTKQRIFQMWERLQIGLAFPQYSDEYIENIVKPINRHCASALNVMGTDFYNTFCSKPWLVISVISAIILLVATLIQTYVAVIGSDKMQPHFPRGG